jgi:hypothetical protein
LEIEERRDYLVAHSLDNPSGLKKELWDTLNNPTKVSQNILQRANIREFSYEGKTLIQISCTSGHEKTTASLYRDKSSIRDIYPKT